MRSAALALLALAFVAPACAQTSSAPAGPPLPPEIDRALEGYREACRELGGTLDLRPGALSRHDLTGKGRSDAVLHLDAARCSGGYSPFCGTGGCDLLIFAADAKGGLTPIFDGRAWRYEVLPGKAAKAPKRIRFQLHGSFCGRAGADGCVKTVTVTGRPFVIREPGAE